MAFSKVLSGGLADDAVSGDNIAPSAYLENTANQNLSGTISQNRMYTSDSYTLTGDLTVNDTVGLISATGNGTNVTVMNDGSNRTITGSGTVEGGELYSHTNSLSGMTGELGSAVTGSIAGLGNVISGTYNSTIGTSATFPDDYQIKCTTSHIGNGSSGQSRTATSLGALYTGSGAFFEIQPVMRDISNAMIITFTTGFDLYGNATGNNIGGGMQIVWSNDNFNSHSAGLGSTANHDYFFQGTGSTAYYAFYGQAVVKARHNPSCSNPRYRLYANVRTTNLSLRISQKGCFMECIEIKA